MSAGEWTKIEQAAHARLSAPGVSSLDEMRNRTGLEFLRDIASGVLPFLPIGKALNFFLPDADEGQGRIFGPDGKLYAHGTTTCLIYPIPEAAKD